MPRLVTFYRVNLQDGITVEERPTRHYRGDPELDRVVFKNLRRAKVAFTDMIRTETRRLQALQKDVGPLKSRRRLKGHAFSAYQAEPAQPEEPERGPVTPLVRVSKAEERLGVGRSVIMRMIKNGDLRSYRIGGTMIRIPESDVEEQRRKLLADA